MEKKYELTNETKKIYGHTLHRIRALKDFGNIKAGDLGGFVESERNLSQEGTCWVSDEARVYGNAEVSGEAIVCDKAQVFGGARVFGGAIVSGEAEVFEEAIVCDKAQVFGGARMYGNAEVSEEARVYGNAEVFGEARVHGRTVVFDKAEVYGKTSIYSGSITSTNDYICIGPIGSRDDFTTFFKDRDKIMVKCGCFKGDIEEFKKAVEREHRENKYAKQYKYTIMYVKSIFGYLGGDVHVYFGRNEQKLAGSS